MVADVKKPLYRYRNCVPMVTECLILQQPKDSLRKKHVLMKGLQMVADVKKPLYRYRHCVPMVTECPRLNYNAALRIPEKNMS